MVVLDLFSFPPSFALPTVSRKVSCNHGLHLKTTATKSHKTYSRWDPRLWPNIFRIFRSLHCLRFRRGFLKKVFKKIFSVTIHSERVVYVIRRRSGYVKLNLLRTHSLNILGNTKDIFMRRIISDHLIRDVSTSKPLYT